MIPSLSTSSSSVYVPACPAVRPNFQNDGGAWLSPHRKSSEPFAFLVLPAELLSRTRNREFQRTAGIVANRLVEATAAYIPIDKSRGFTPH